MHRKRGRSFYFLFLTSLGPGCISACPSSCRRRPCRVECTGSFLTSEVKRLRARLALGSGTAWEYLRVLALGSGTAWEYLRMLSAFCPQPLPQTGSSIQLVRLDAACRELQSRRAPKATRPRRGRQEQIHSRCHKRGAASSWSV